MKMKKILSVAAVLAICASLGVSASAASVPASHDSYTDVIDGSVSVNFTKVYDSTNENTTHPSEKLKFTAKSTDTNAPTVTFGENGVVTTTKGADTTVPVKITGISKYGVYTYNVTEELADGENAAPGVDYATGYKLIVSVVYNEATEKVQVAYALKDSKDTKTDNISNTYSAGTLVIESKTTGNLGDKEENFTATVTFTNPVDPGDTSIPGVEWNDDKTVATITYKDGTTITIPNIPYGTEYTVTESDTKDYKFEQNPTDNEGGKTGKIDSKEETDVLTNKKGNNEIDTGLNLDSVPYALALAGVAVAGGSIVIRRRRVND